MARDMNRRFLFDTVADLYDEARPGYPEALADDVVAISGIPPHGRILEVGAGPGQATKLFAARGYRIVALELGANLAAKARENLAAFPDAKVLNVPFEDWEVEPGAFDLVISGSAFHWIPPEVGYPRCAEALKPGGWIALFWNGHGDMTGPVYDAIQEAYDRCTPEMSQRHHRQTTDLQGSADPLREDRAGAIVDSGYFEAPELREYPWSRELTSEQYVKLCCTYSDHIALPDEQRAALCQGIAEAIDAHGGTVVRPYVTKLYIARKK